MTLHFQCKSMLLRFSSVSRFGRTCLGRSALASQPVDIGPRNAEVGHLAVVERFQFAYPLAIGLVGAVAGNDGRDEACKDHDRSPSDPVGSRPSMCNAIYVDSVLHRTIIRNGRHAVVAWRKRLPEG